MVGFFLFFLRGTLCKVSRQMQFKVIAVLSSGGSVRAQTSLPEFTVNHINFLGNKSLQRKKSQETLFVIISSRSRLFLASIINKNKEHGTKLTSFASDSFGKKAG